jgi:hypothetical protein
LRRAPSIALLLLALAVTVAREAAAAPAAGEDPREQTARAFFAAGKYQDAIDVFVQLFAERPHPNYLLNIGRCYQNLSEPDKAIASFREYLRKAKVSAKERREIDGDIREMQELQEHQSSVSGALDKIVPPAPAQPAVAEKPPAPSPAAPPAPAPLAAAEDKPPAPRDPVQAQLADWRARGEALWHEQAARADNARIPKLEAQLAGAPPNDPLIGEYRLFLGRLYAAKHFQGRLKVNATRRLDAGAGAAPPDLKSLNAEVTDAFLKAVSAYVDASNAKSFAGRDEALFQLALILDANNMEARAAAMLTRLVKNMPSSKFARQVLASGGGSP